MTASCLLIVFTYDMQTFTRVNPLLVDLKLRDMQTFARVYQSSKKSPVVKEIDELLSNHQCKDLYIDMGTNIGVQPRKLVESSCYPLSRGVFRHVFGQTAVDKKEVCIIGFEPNRNHKNRLEMVEKRLRSRGAVIKIFTEVGIGGTDGHNMSFYSDHHSRKHEWASGIIPAKIRPIATAGGISVVSMHSVLQAVKDYGLINRLLIKLDIEGSEYDAIAGAIGHGVFCSVAKNGSYIVLEQHPHFSPRHVPSNFLQSVNFISQFTEGCTLQIVGGDDESYLHDVHNLSEPGCIL